MIFLNFFIILFLYFQVTSKNLLVDDPLSSTITYGDDPLSRPAQLISSDFDETCDDTINDFQPWSHCKQSILNSYTTSEKLSFHSCNYDSINKYKIR